MNLVNILLLSLSVFVNFFGDTSQSTFAKNNCSLPDKIIKNIDSYGKVVQQIYDFVVNGKDKGVTYAELAKFVDKFGPRLSGSKVLEDAIDYAVNRLTESGLDVHTEEAQVPHWIRANETAFLVKPRPKRVALMGLGGSVGTPKDGILADAIVVKSFDELKARANEVKGKIVVFDQDFVSYPQTVQYRQFAAANTAKLGGVASLVRSITPFSIYSPHMGWQDYAENVTKIPTACITVEDANMLHRMSLRGEKITIHLMMGAQNLPPVMSRNTVAEIRGKRIPEQVVLVSGHLDSWDVGQGAMDDGGGAFISWRALDVVRKLKLQPARTMRSVLWTGEEEGIWGGQAYFRDHKAQKDNFSIIMESDIGTFTPRGLTFSSKNQTAICMMARVLDLFEFMNATRLEYGTDGPDIGQWMDIGVPGASLINDNSNYFYFHHSDGDTMDVEDPHALDLCTAFWTGVSYISADMKEMFPR